MVRKIVILLIVVSFSQMGFSQYLKNNAISIGLNYTSFSAPLLNNPVTLNSSKSWGINGRYYGKISNHFAWSAEMGFGRLVNLGLDSNEYDNSSITSINMMLVHQWNNGSWLKIKPSLLQPFIQVGYKIDYIPIRAKKVIVGLNVGIGSCVNINKNWGLIYTLGFNQRLGADYRTSLFQQLGIIIKLPKNKVIKKSEW